MTSMKLKCHKKYYQKQPIRIFAEYNFFLIFSRYPQNYSGAGVLVFSEGEILVIQKGLVHKI